MFTGSGGSQKDVLIANESVVTIGGKTSINMVVSTDVLGSGILDIWAKVGDSIWIDTTQFIDLASGLNTITSITGAPYSQIKLVPITSVSETQTDFVFASAGKTITTVLGNFSTFSDGDIITVTGTSLNDGTYTIVGAPSATVITVVEVLEDETPAVSMTIQTFGATTTYSVNVATS